MISFEEEFLEKLQLEHISTENQHLCGDTKKKNIKEISKNEPESYEKFIQLMTSLLALEKNNSLEFYHRSQRNSYLRPTCFKSFDFNWGSLLN